MGTHCAESSCNQLDFLPVKCDACQKSFCNDHWQYGAHNCPQGRSRDVQVPVCPLCDKPVPSKPGAPPDAAVSAHLDRDCRAEAREKKNPRCSLKKCKVRELIKVDCDVCRKNFCFKHRHPQDHECAGKPDIASAAGAAAMARQASSSSSGASGSSSISRFFRRQQENPSRPNARTIQGGLSEDEALARALQESMKDGQPHPGGQSSDAPMTQEEQDRMLAMALAQSERDQRQAGPSNTTTTTTATGNKSCHIS